MLSKYRRFACSDSAALNVNWCSVFRDYRFVNLSWWIMKKLFRSDSSTAFIKLSLSLTRRVVLLIYWFIFTLELSLGSYFIASGCIWCFNGWSFRLMLFRGVTSGFQTRSWRANPRALSLVLRACALVHLPPNNKETLGVNDAGREIRTFFSLRTVLCSRTLKQGGCNVTIELKLVKVLFISLCYLQGNKDSQPLLTKGEIYLFFFLHLNYLLSLV